jgi:glucosyl-dolichyl phosphate glucuronosyltransferase
MTFDTMAKGMKVSVILCTYNRSESLAKALASVARSKVPESIQWEVLVVDNNSRDATRSVVEEFCRRDPSRFRYLFEPKQGKSYALNAGIQAARGEILAFTDDDVTVEPTWLQNLTACLDKGEWVGAGGRTFPERAFTAPSWLRLEDPCALGPLGMFDLGAEACELTVPPSGNNMAYRTEAFEKYGSFRTELGPRPGSEIRSEDKELGQRLLSAGERLRYVPSAIVYHAVPASRIHKSYFLVWWFDYGRALIREKGRRPPVWGIPRHYLSIPNMIAICLPQAVLRWMCTLNPQQRFSRKCWASIMVGQTMEIYRLARDAKSQ